MIDVTSQCVSDRPRPVRGVWQPSHSFTGIDVRQHLGTTPEIL
jgi:hypothetical protein